MSGGYSKIWFGPCHSAPSGRGEEGSAALPAYGDPEHSALLCVCTAPKRS